MLFLLSEFVFPASHDRDFSIFVASIRARIPEFHVKKMSVTIIWEEIWGSMQHCTISVKYLALNVLRIVLKQTILAGKKISL